MLLVSIKLKTNTKARHVFGAKREISKYECQVRQLVTVCYKVGYLNETLTQYPTSILIFQTEID